MLTVSEERGSGEHSREKGVESSGKNEYDDPEDTTVRQPRLESIEVCELGSVNTLSLASIVYKYHIKNGSSIHI